MSYLKEEAVDQHQINKLNDEYGNKSAEEILQKTFDLFGSQVVLASSFSVEDTVIIDMAAAITPNFRVITLDTGRLPEATFELMDKLQYKYKVSIETFFPDQGKIELLTQKKGFYSFRESIENRKECCYIRKVEPLMRALKGNDAWITGRRQSQSVTRSDMPVFEIDDSNHGMIKINPLSKWSREEAWEYVKKKNVPYNRLYDRGFLSIGCSPCTRPVESGEDERSGRWWWEDPDKKECGIHRS